MLQEKLASKIGCGGWHNYCITLNFVEMVIETLGISGNSQYICSHWYRIMDMLILDTSATPTNWLYFLITMELWRRLRLIPIWP